MNVFLYVILTAVNGFLENLKNSVEQMERTGGVLLYNHDFEDMI